jgi:hypothetical protein
VHGVIADLQRIPQFTLQPRVVHLKNVIAWSSSRRWTLLRMAEITGKNS